VLALQPTHAVIVVDFPELLLLDPPQAVDPRVATRSKHAIAARFIEAS
jgi:hypothetical protein